MRLLYAIQPVPSSAFFFCFLHLFDPLQTGLRTLFSISLSPSFLLSYFKRDHVCIPQKASFYSKRASSSLPPRSLPLTQPSLRTRRRLARARERASTFIHSLAGSLSRQNSHPRPSVLQRPSFQRACSLPASSLKFSLGPTASAYEVLRDYFHGAPLPGRPSTQRIQSSCLSVL